MDASAGFYSHNEWWSTNCTLLPLDCCYPVAKPGTPFAFIPICHRLLCCFYCPCMPTLLHIFLLLSWSFHKLILLVEVFAEKTLAVFSEWMNPSIHPPINQFIQPSFTLPLLLTPSGSWGVGANLSFSPEPVSNSQQKKQCCILRACKAI